MTPTGRITTSLPAPVITSPNAFGLPLRDRGGPDSATRALVDTSWPVIEALLADGRYDMAIDKLTALARSMQETTAVDDEAWRDTIDSSRALLYDAIVEIARAGGIRDRGIDALDTCRAWDHAHRRELGARRASLARERS